MSRTNRTEVTFSVAEMALITAAARVTHPTTKGANIARAIREAAISAARPVLLNLIADQTRAWRALSEQPEWIRAEDQPAVEAELRKLRRIAGSALPADDDLHYHYYRQGRSIEVRAGRVYGQGEVLGECSGDPASSADVKGGAFDNAGRKLRHRTEASRFNDEGDGEYLMNVRPPKS